MKKILIATDGSGSALAAIDAGLELAAEDNSEVVFVHVTSTLDFPSAATGSQAPERVPQMDTDPVLVEALEQARRCSVPAKAELLIGHAPKQIIRLAREIEADLIVVGSRGLGLVQSAILGSTSREVVRKAGRPVMIVRTTGVRELVEA